MNKTSSPGSPFRFGWHSYALTIVFLGSIHGNSWGEEKKPVDYLTQIRPILASRCFECHGPTKERNNLRLDSANRIRKGGDAGSLFIAGRSAESLLIHRLTGSNGLSRMPGKGDPLTPDQIALFRTWIDQGAKLPEKDPNSGDSEWWSFRPIQGVKVPEVPIEFRNWIRTPVDAFILDKLLANGLRPSPETDRRTLIRRVTIDLTGLPPTPEEISQFVNDPAPDAYERLVDRLLNSPRYGERWTRHWLDIVHYADSHGQDQDRPRPNAWPYRDYVIDAFNSDKPYDRFIKEQVAGDVLFPIDPKAIVATGFLAAGPWDESGLRDIREDSLDRLVSIYLDRDDIVTSTMSTFTALTVGCARCHDHKFDPITQDDYYSLQAVFSGVDKAERTYDADPKTTTKRASLTKQISQLRELRGKVDPSLLTSERQAEVAIFEKAWARAKNQWVVPELLTCRSKQGSILKPLLDRSILAVGKRPDKDVYTVQLSTDQKILSGLRLDVLCDETLPHRGPGRQENGNLHLSEVRVSVRGKGKSDSFIPIKLKSATADFNQIDWDITRAIDGKPATAWGIYPAIGQPHQAVFEFDQPVRFPEGVELRIELDQLHGDGHLIGRFRLALTSASTLTAIERPIPSTISELFAIPVDKRTPLQQAELARQIGIVRLEQELQDLPPTSRIYCGTKHFAPDGTFRPSKSPRSVHIMKRGDVTKPLQWANPGAIEAIPRLRNRFQITDPNDEGQRRAALAMWLTDSANPLTWRVLVNRVWHYHFGKGIVDTPNDFGKMGGTPSHPELLNWLATEFRDSGGSLKKLHRLLVTSSVYRQSVLHNSTYAAKDGDNRLLWRMNRGRLDAETVRDSLLLISGKLDPQMGGAPVLHFIMSPGAHVTPNADYETFDVDKPEARRRSIYRYLFRTHPDPMLETLDCPDASMSAPVRTVSVSALQALALWNNKFTLRYAEHLAELAKGESPNLDKQIGIVCQRTLGRLPSESEQRTWGEYVRKHGLANLCRVLFNSSEFLFID